jgi:hypothetical protein
MSIRPHLVSIQYVKFLLSKSFEVYTQGLEPGKKGQAWFQTWPCFQFWSYAPVNFSWKWDIHVLLAHFYPEGSSAFFKTNKNAIDTGKNWCEIWIFGFCWCELSNYTTIFLIWGNIESCLYNIKKQKPFLILFCY